MSVMKIKGELTILSANQSKIVYHEIKLLMIKIVRQVSALRAFLNNLIIYSILSVNLF